MSFRNRVMVAIWYLSNFIGLGLIAFSDRPIVKMIAVAYEAVAISTGGLVSIGGLMLIGSKSDE